MYAGNKITLFALASYALCATASASQLGLKPRLLGVDVSLGLGPDQGPASTTTFPPFGSFSSLPPVVSSTSKTSTTSSTSSSTSSRTSSSTSSTRTTSKPTTWTSALVTSSTKPLTTTVVTTKDGSTVSTVVTTSQVVKSTTGFATGTSLPQSGDENPTEDSGMDADKTKIIAGVVGGVGGAIVLGIIVFVIWRLRRKNLVSYEHVDLMSGQESSLKYSPVGTMGTTGTQATSSPFQTTLDQYHNPGGRVNASSNF